MNFKCSIIATWMLATTIVASPITPAHGLDNYELVPARMQGVVNRIEVKHVGDVLNFHAKALAAYPAYIPLMTRDSSPTPSFNSPICQLQGNDWLNAKEAKYKTVWEAIKHLQNDNLIVQGPRKCSRISCVPGAGIYFCNDMPWEINWTKISSLAAMADAIRNRCEKGKQRAYGQCFVKELGYNVIVKYSNCRNEKDEDEDVAD